MGRGGLRGIRKQLGDSPSSLQLGTYYGISSGGGLAGGQTRQEVGCVVLQTLLGSLAVCLSGSHFANVCSRVWETADGRMLACVCACV